MAKQITFISLTSKEHTMTSRRIIPVLLLALALSACGGAAASPSALQAEQAPAVVAPAAPPQDANRALDQQGGGASAPAGSTTGNENTQQQFDRLVIKTAQISLQVENVPNAEAAVRAKVQELGGYVVKAENSGSDEKMTAQINFRVPAQ